jgi:tetratricopeptide (TPR) repeat protein
MNCRECGSRVDPNDLVCGNCGAVVDVTPIAALPVRVPAPSTRNAPRRRGLSPTAILILLFAFGMIALITTSILLGVSAGLQDRVLDQQAEADKYYHEGLTNFASGQLQLAEADFQYVLKVESNYPGASEQLAQVRARLIVQPTPTIAVSSTKVIDQLYQTSQSAYQAKDWARAIEVLSQVRSIDPKYQAAKVTEQLYQAAMTFGLSLLKQDRLEEGIAYLDQAAYIKDLPSEATLESQYARMYLTARGYWAVDWQKAIDRFTELYKIGPGYQDTFVRLVEAHLNYAAQLSQTLDYCGAQQNFEAANQLRPDPKLQPTIDDLNQKCLISPLSGTPNPAGTPGGVDLSGLFAGRLAYPTYDAGSRVLAASAGNTSIYVAAIGDQPELQRNGSNMVFRLSGTGVNIVNLTNGAITTIAPPGASWPTFSPDGSRVIYSLQDRLYVIDAQGSGSAIDLGAGSRPVWGPTGLLAYSGCDGGGTCGIMLRNPDSAEAPRRLTGSLQDIPTAWSPDGFNISYFSNVTGEYDLFFVNTAGGVQQVTNGSGNNIAGAWGPDGAHVAFLSDRDGTWSVYIARFDGQEAQKLIVAPQGSDWANTRLSWMP